MSGGADLTVESNRSGPWRRRHGWPAVACALALLTAGACGGGGGSTGPVKVSYDQAANFFTYRVNVGDQPSSTPGAIFVMYRITKITTPNGVPFTFDKHSVLAGAPGKTRNEEPAEDAQLLGDRLLNNLQVAPGKTVNDPGCIIKLVDASPNPAKQGSELIPATYQKGSQNVRMERSADDNVTTAVTQATAISLKNFCRA